MIPGAESRVEGQRGFSLLEVVMTVAIMGLLITAGLGAMATIWSESAVHRQQADATATLASAAERIKSSDTPYVPCVAGDPSPGVIDPLNPPGTLTAYLTSLNSVALPSGWTRANSTLTISNVTYETRTATGANFDDLVCHDSGGLTGQQITIKASGPSGKVVQTLSFVKTGLQ